MNRTYRHRLPVRLTHWINVLCLPILVLSGFQIFNAHPALYWGERSDRDRPILAMKAIWSDAGDITKGVTTVFGHEFDTTGVLGASTVRSGDLVPRGFPSWATLPGYRSLAMGRRWHLFFAWLFVLNGVLFGLYALLSRHLFRDLWPRVNDLRHIPRSILDHLRFRHAHDEGARYNVLQKLAYTGVVFGLAPVAVLAGLAMSPQLDAAFPWLPALFGGRQSARTVHFIASFAFIGYTAVHVLMVVTTGFRNNLRSMITGWYGGSESGGRHEPH
jgi:thiosulfate reductase cytochrome b subunit